MNAPLHHAQAVRTTCPYCGVGCGVLAKPDGNGGALIVGDPGHPANFGRLCSKGSALGETLGYESRLLHPMLRQPDESFKRTSWHNAIDQVATGFKRVIDEHGPDAVAFYLSGQLLTEDYYVANKLMKGFIGSANVDTNSRLCMASPVAGHRRAFGADTVPGVYEDIDLADLIVLVGSNAGWCHPILYQRMVANTRERGARIVVIDPRRTVTAEDADLFLPIAPGMDTILFSGLLVHLANGDALDRAFVEQHTSGLPEALSRARELAPDVSAVAKATGLEANDVLQFFELFRTTKKTVTCFSQGVNQSAQGTDKVTSIINCHLATGRIGKPGTGPFSLTGQPNAMGGREVGGLANQLAAHMSFVPDDIDRVSRFWNAPAISRREGLKAVDMFEAVERGEIKALWVMGSNPAVSLPRAGAMRAAMGRLDLFVVSENVVSNDTVNAGAHVLLPAAAWAEKDGTVTNSERRISRQRAFLPLPGEVRSDWRIVTDVAHRMGFGEQFKYESAADIFREHAALSAFENDGKRDFDIGALATLSNQAFDALEPVLWPMPEGRKSEKRFFADGRFFTDNYKAKMVAVESPSPRATLTDQFPFYLNTGRIRDQWHTMTRSGLSAQLASHSPEPFVEIHPDDAAAFRVVQGGFARVASRYGSCVLKVIVSAGQRRGSLFAPIHWSDQTASSGRVGDLVAPANDPYSGQPESKATPASIEPVSFAYRGFALGRGHMALPADTWWARFAITDGFGLTLATNRGPQEWRAWVQGAIGTDTEVVEYLDESGGRYRTASFYGGRLFDCLFIGPAETPPQWDAVKALFTAEALSGAQRRNVLSGKTGDGLMDPGPLVCSCFGVGVNTIRSAIERGTAASVEELGTLLRAGTNCGSCIPELKSIFRTANDCIS